MKHSKLSLALLAGALVISTGAQANNTTVENALKSRPELSSFYNGLVSTGILSELKDGMPYTVFAPTNDAFAKISQDKYPCFYQAECKGRVAEILRKHIVPGEKHLSDISPDGGIMSLFSIDNQHIVASEPSKDRFTVDGSKVINENQLLGGDLYTIDALMVPEKDLVQFEAPQVVMIHQPGSDLPPSSPPGKIVTITTTTTDATHPIPH